MRNPPNCDRDHPESGLTGAVIDNINTLNITEGKGGTDLRGDEGP